MIRFARSIASCLLLAVAASIALTGCAGYGKRGVPSKFAPDDLFAQPIENPDIIAALTNGAATGYDATSKKFLEKAEFARAFDNALLAFEPTKVARNRVQDRLILASNELCENYKVLLKKKQARFNFWSGSAATAFGAAGGAVTGVDGARALSTISGVVSGVRAEYNQQYFSDLAAHVITKGINARRKEILKSIYAARAGEPDQYSVELAIADAITYHGACSLVGGLEQADTTLSKFTGDVGLDALAANPAYQKLQEELAEKKKQAGAQPDPPPAPPAAQPQN